MWVKEEGRGGGERGRVICVVKEEGRGERGEEEGRGGGGG